MKNQVYIPFTAVLLSALMLLLGPLDLAAQRRIGGAGGVRHMAPPPHPVPHPAPHPYPGPHPYPPGPHPVPVPHPVPPPAPHPYPHPYPGPHPYPYPRPYPVPVPVPVPVAPIYPYYYHPFTPYYWGPAWHPFGFFVATLTTAAIIVTVSDHSYRYDNGVYYDKSGSGYEVVPAPIGAEVPSLPDGYHTVKVNDTKYYDYGGTFYVKEENKKFKVVAPPPGIVVESLPQGATEVTVSNQKYMLYNGTYYQPVVQDGKQGYEVMQMQTQPSSTTQGTN